MKIRPALTASAISALFAAGATLSYAQTNQAGPASKEAQGGTQSGSSGAAEKGGASGAASGKADGKAEGRTEQRSSQDKGAGKGESSKAGQTEKSDRKAAGTDRKSDQPAKGAGSGDAPAKGEAQKTQKSDDRPAGSTKDTSAGTEKSKNKSASDRESGKADNDKQVRDKQAQDKTDTQTKEQAGTKAKDQADTSKEGTATGRGSGQATGERDTTGGSATGGSTAAGAAKGDQDRDRSARSGGDLSQEQRTTVRSTIEREKVRRHSNVDFDINVGANVPRNFELYPLPSRIFETVPRYRNYRYVVVDEEIVIIDPQTYRIVEVIEDEAGGSVRGTAAGSAGRAGLSLSDEDQRFVIETVELRTAPRAGDIRLEIGAEIPGSVELSEFPDRVVSRVPQLKRYRYVVIEQQLAVVDPQQKRVELLIRE